MNNNDILNLFKGFKAIPDKENEKDIIEEYVKDLITKEEFLEKMKNANPENRK